MRDQLVAEATNFTIRNKQKRRNIHALRDIRTHNPSSEAVVDLRLRLHGHRDRPEAYLLRKKIFFIKINHSIDKPVTARIKKKLLYLLKYSSRWKKTSNRKFALDLNKVYILYYKIPTRWSVLNICNLIFEFCGQ